MAGDTRVLAWDMTTGGVSTFYDLGAGSAGQVAIGSNYLAAVT
ncbi:MAG: hypothetical protein ABI836_00165 [Gemmatimonadota bacterium]